MVVLIFTIEITSDIIQQLFFSFVAFQEAVQQKFTNKSFLDRFNNLISLTDYV